MTLPDSLEDLLKILKAGNVLVFKHGDLLIQCTPAPPEFEAHADDANTARAGGWKRGPNLNED